MKALNRIMLDVLSVMALSAFLGGIVGYAIGRGI